MPNKHSHKHTHSSEASAKGTAEAKSNYSGLQKKYNLPELEILERMFDCSELAEEKFPLREVLKSIAERLDWSARFMETLLQPEHMASFIEAESLSEKTKKEIISLHRKLMFWYRSTQMQILNTEDRENAEFILKFIDEWKSLQPGIEGMLRLAQNSWKDSLKDAGKDSDKSMHGKAGYFG